jgi:hypothetical protein
MCHCHHNLALLPMVAKENRPCATSPKFEKMRKRAKLIFRAASPKTYQTNTAERG